MNQRLKIEEAYDEYSRHIDGESVAKTILYTLEMKLSYQCEVYEEIIQVLDENNRLLSNKKYRKAINKKWELLDQKMNQQPKNIKRFDLVMVGGSRVVGRVIDIDPVAQTAQVSFWDRVFTFDLRFLRGITQEDIYRSPHQLKSAYRVVDTRQVG